MIWQKVNFLYNIGLRPWYSKYCGPKSCRGPNVLKKPTCTHQCGPKVTKSF